MHYRRRKENASLKDLLQSNIQHQKIQKFLDATLDLALQSGVVEKINGYYGSKFTKVL